MRPDDHIAACTAAHARLVALVDRLDNEAARAPSRLPGWTVGHVLTHLARNADSHVRAFEGANRGEVWARYPGGDVQREGDIEAGAGRSAAALRADVAATNARLEAMWAAATDAAWTGACLGAGPEGIPMVEMPFRRWREVECHAADLGLGYTPADWPDAYVDEELRLAAAALGPPPAAVARLDRNDQAAWVMGRLDMPGVPAPGQWY